MERTPKKDDASKGKTKTRRLLPFFSKVEKVTFGAEEYVALLNSAKEGNPAAQFAVASAIDSGELRCYDPEATLFWYRKAAEQGWHPAIENFGNLGRTFKFWPTLRSFDC